MLSFDSLPANDRRRIDVRQDDQPLFIRVHGQLAGITWCIIAVATPAVATMMASLGSQFLAVATAVLMLVAATLRHVHRTDLIRDADGIQIVRGPVFRRRRELRKIRRYTAVQREVQSAEGHRGVVTRLYAHTKDGQMVELGVRWLGHDALQWLAQRLNQKS